MSAVTPLHEDDEHIFIRPGKWTLIVILHLKDSTLRFNELRRVIGGISQKTLTITLRELERDGFITRTLHASIPPRVDYELTQLGHELLALVEGIKVFARTNRDQIVAARQRYDAARDEPVLRVVGGEW
jgi:DNA-binding HxlR family transcriptional regulator